MTRMDEYKKSLAREIYDKCWSGDYWGVNGAIQKAKELYWLRVRSGKRHTALSALSSVYFSASGNAKAHLLHGSFLLKPLWLLRAFLCIVHANRLSDKLERTTGIKKMSPDELDVRIAIMLSSLRHASAKACLEEISSRDNVSVDTMALVYAHFLNHSFTSEEDAIAYGSNLRILLLGHVRSTTRVRVLRDMGRFYKKRGDQKSAGEFFADALAIAEEEGLKDQIIKIKAAMR